MLTVDICKPVKIALLMLLLSGQKIVDAAALYAQDVLFGRFVALSDYPRSVVDKTTIGQPSIT